MFVENSSVTTLKSKSFPLELSLDLTSLISMVNFFEKEKAKFDKSLHIN